MLQPALSGRGGRGQCRDLAGVTDALYGALGVLAASQGTMNNFTFGNETYQYYETICGGAGAGPEFRRRERRAHAHDQLAPDRSRGAGVALSGAARGFPIRRGSGGAGRYHGGDGGERRVRFLQPMTAAMLANRRRVAPFGIAGGLPGALGRQLGRARRWHARGIRRHFRSRDARRRRVRRANAGRRRLRRAVRADLWQRRTAWWIIERNAARSLHERSHLRHRRGRHSRQAQETRPVQGQGAADRERGERVRLHAAIQRARGAVREAASARLRDTRLSLQPVRRPGARQRGARSRSSANSTTV